MYEPKLQEPNLQNRAFFSVVIVLEVHLPCLLLDLPLLLRRRRSPVHQESHSGEVIPNTVASLLDTFMLMTKIGQSMFIFFFRL